MSFTKDKFENLPKHNRIKKVIFSIREYLDNKKELSYPENLLSWLNDYEKYNFDAPSSKDQWEELLNILLNELYKLDPFLEESPYDHSWEQSLIMPIKVVLDNIRSPYNVGSIFRNADAFGVEEIILCGITPTPIENPKTNRTARDVNVKFSCNYDIKKSIMNLKSGGYTIYSLEKTSGSKEIGQVDFKKPLAVILGNEEFGISKEVLEISDEIIHINMLGKKNSLNVSTASGIALYEIIRHIIK